MVNLLEVFGLKNVDLKMFFFYLKRLEFSGLFLVTVSHGPRNK